MKQRGSSTAWRDYSGRVARPTVLLAKTTVVVWTTVVVMHGLGHLATSIAAFLSLLACYLALTCAHEAAHGNVGGRERPALDALVGWWSMFILLGPFPPFRELHLRHHAYTNHPTKDPDMWVAVTGPQLVLRCLTIVPRYYKAYLFPPRGVRKLVAHTRRAAVGFFLFYATLAAAMVASGLGSTLLWVMIMPAWLALSLLAFVFDWLPHHPHRERTRFLNARLFPSRRLEVLLLGQNYHLVHHAWPSVPWYRYGTLFRRVRGLLRARGTVIVERRSPAPRREL